MPRTATVAGSDAQSEKLAGAARQATPLTLASLAASDMARAPLVPAPTTHAPPADAPDADVTTNSRSSSHPPSEKSPSDSPTPLKQQAMTRHPDPEASRSEREIRLAGMRSGGPLSVGKSCERTSTAPLEPGGRGALGSWTARRPAGPDHCSHTGELFTGVSFQMPRWFRSEAVGSDPDSLCQQLPVVARISKEKLRGFRALEVQVCVVFPGEPDPSMDLDVLGRRVEIRL